VTPALCPVAILAAPALERRHGNERSDHPFTKRSGDMVYTSVLD
jgi:hypothetical protein